MKDGNQNGKGDSPKSCFSKDFKNNYDLIDWKSERRNKVQKMFGVETNNPSCWYCRGEGKYISIENDRVWEICEICNGKKTLPIEVWKETLFNKTKS